MLKKPPNTNNYNQTKPKKQSKPKTQLKVKPPESLGAQLSNYNNQRKKKSN
jgi:hypothetical protein